MLTLLTAPNPENVFLSSCSVAHAGRGPTYSDLYRDVSTIFHPYLSSSLCRRCVLWLWTSGADNVGGANEDW